MRFIVVGAGAVGGVLGGYLAMHQHKVVLVCRPAHAAAIREHSGLRIKSATGEFTAHLDAEADVADVSFEDACVLLTAKSYDTQTCLDAIAAVAPAAAPVVSFQNGIANEPMIAERFINTFGGVVRMTCSFLQPGQVTVRKQGRVVVGKYPKGADPFAKQLGAAFEEAGFDTSVSRAIESDKWLKLVVNLQSVWNAVIETRDHDTREFVDLKVGVIEEAQAVLKAAKIKAKPCDGRDMTIEEMITDLRKPRAGRQSSAVRVNNSTWQNLYLGRDRIENAYYHQPIIDLAKANGVAVPFNEAALELAEQSVKEGAGPNALRVNEAIERVRQRGTEH